MPTRTPDVPSELVPAIESTARALLAGGMVLYPTETFYGLGACVSLPEAVRKIAALKGRGSDRPMPVIVADEAAARELFREVPKAAEPYIRSFWPGPLTIVLPARSGLPFEVAPSGKVGVRVSSHPVARELARLAGPLVATSANEKGGREASRLSKVDPKLRQAVQAALDAGETPGGRPSTVLGFKGEEPVLLREGAIQKALIDACRNGS